MLRARHVPLVLRAVGRWLVGSKTGRRVGAGLVALGAAGVWLASDGAPDAKSGRWKGLHNHIAPNDGAFTLSGGKGERATCTLRGQTGSASGSGWVFRGDATVRESRCEGRVDKAGKVSLDLTLELAWDGRQKGIGGDWEDVSGGGTCRGELVGTLEDGGTWTGKCKNDDYTWEAKVGWELDR